MSRHDDSVSLIVGEAATRISKSMQATHPGIPWREIIGTRNRLIHGYDAVDYDILWEIVSTDFPELVRELRALLLDTENMADRK